MLVALILTFGKGGYLITAIVFIYAYAQKALGFLKKTLGQKNIRLLGICLIIFAGTAFSIYYYQNIGAAASPHFWGIMQTWQSILKRPLGHGIGNGGNAATLYGSSAAVSWLASGGETQLMSFFYQIGIQGGLIFILCVIKTMLPPQTRTHFGNEIFIVIPFALLGLSLLQDNTFTPQCIVLFMILQGAANRIYSNAPPANEITYCGLETGAKI